MPYTFRHEADGRVAAIKKETGKVAFHSDSMEAAKRAARAREMHDHMSMEGRAALSRCLKQSRNARREPMAAAFEQHFAKGRRAFYAELPSEHADVTPAKAREILRDGEVHGHPLSEAQKGFFGAIAGKDKNKLTPAGERAMWAQVDDAGGSRSTKDGSYHPEEMEGEWHSGKGGKKKPKGKKKHAKFSRKLLQAARAAMTKIDL